ncbi:MAG: hypothetical protein OXF02_05805 [Simkaniaceae bacterium]|nr:hypothetical protein [Simkaniaceae bacterium]
MSVSSISKFLTDSFFGGFVRAYRYTHHKSDPPTDSLPSDRTEEPRDGHSLLENMKADKQWLLDREGVREDIAFVRVDNLSSELVWLGANVFRSGDAVVSLAGDLCRVDRDCAGFLSNRGIEHILSNDAVTLSVADGVNGLVRPVILGTGCFKAIRAFSRRGVAGVVAPLLGTATGCFVVNRVVGALFRWRATKAYDFAIAHATDEELKGGRRFFTVWTRIEREESRILRDLFVKYFPLPLRLWRQWIRTSCPGRRYLCNFREASFTSLLRKVEKALVVREIEIDEEVEEQRMERLRICEVECTKLSIRHKFSSKEPSLVMEEIYGSMIRPDATDTSEES